MAPVQSKPPAAKKRTRKRKRRAASSSSESSSSDDSSSSDSETPNQVVVRVPAKTAKKPQVPQPEPSDVSSSSSSSSSSESESENDSEVEPVRAPSPTVATSAPSKKPARRTPSPTPPPSSIPSFLPPSNSREQEQVLKERFRKFWMASVADAFKDDLEVIRKEPNLTSSRLAMLIDSLAAGGEVLTTSQVGPDSNTTEMEIVLDHNT